LCRRRRLSTSSSSRSRRVGDEHREYQRQPRSAPASPAGPSDSVLAASCRAVWRWIFKPGLEGGSSLLDQIASRPRRRRKQFGDKPLDKAVDDLKRGVNSRSRRLSLRLGSLAANRLMAFDQIVAFPWVPAWLCLGFEPSRNFLLPLRRLSGAEPFAVRRSLFSRFFLDLVEARPAPRRVRSLARTRQRPMRFDFQHVVYLGVRYRGGWGGRPLGAVLSFPSARAAQPSRRPAPRERLERKILAAGRFPPPHVFGRDKRIRARMRAFFFRPSGCVSIFTDLRGGAFSRNKPPAHSLQSSGASPLTSGDAGFRMVSDFARPRRRFAALPVVALAVTPERRRVRRSLSLARPAAGASARNLPRRRGR